MYPTLRNEEAPSMYHWRFLWKIKLFLVHVSYKKGFKPPKPYQDVAFLSASTSKFGMCMHKQANLHVYCRDYSFEKVKSSR